MKYVKGDVILPEHLLKEIQKYVQGELIYIPQEDGVRKRWGEKSGQRAKLTSRNQEIRKQFKSGISLDQLMSSYHLSYETIKKIVYTTKY